MSGAIKGPSFTVERNALLPALAAVNRAIERRNTIPILGNVLIHTDGDLLTVTGTNLDIEVSSPARLLSASDANAFTVSSSLIHAAVSKLPDGCEIVFTCGADTISMVAGRARMQFATLPAIDFPNLGGSDFTHQFTIHTRELVRILNTTSFAISTEESRYYLNGIFMHRLDEHLALAATDGHQLASIKIAAPTGSEDMPGIIIPRASLAPILHCAKVGGDAVVHLSDRKIRVAFRDGTTVTSKLIDGTFPDYQRVIPTLNDKNFTVDREALLAAVGRVSLVADEKSSAIRFTFDGDNVGLEANNNATGNMEELVSLSDSDAENASISLNYKYCVNVLNATDAAELRFSINTHTDPCLASPVLESGTAPIFIIMPIRQ